MPVRSAEREQFLADIITCAVEGGTGYWATVLRYQWRGIPTAAVHAVLMEEDDEHERAFNAHARHFREQNGRKPTVSDLIAMDPKCGDDPLFYIVNLDLIARGLGRIRQGDVQIADVVRDGIRNAEADKDAGMIDAGDADVIVQIGMFGQIVYG